MTEAPLKNWIIARCKKWIKQIQKHHENALSQTQVNSTMDLFSQLIPAFEEFEILNVTPQDDNKTNILSYIETEYQSLKVQTTNTLNQSITDDHTWTEEINTWLFLQIDIAFNHKKAELIADFAFNANAHIKTMLKNPRLSRNIPYTQIKQDLNNLPNNM